MAAHASAGAICSGQMRAGSLLYNHRMRTAFLLSLTLSALIAVKPISAAADDLSAATKLYTSGDTVGAVKLLDGVLHADSKNAGARYLRANCLMKLNRLSEAAHEYELVMHLSPRSKLAEHASSAITQINAAQRSTASDTAGGVKETGVASGASKLPPGTIEFIRKQASKARERALEDGKAQANGELQKAESQARAEQERVERMANSGHNRIDHHPLSAAELAAMRSRAAANAEALKQIGSAKAAWKEQEAEEKAENLKRQAEELEEQLVNNDRNYKGRTVKLNPVGTNLYIRNYSSARPPIKALDALPQHLPAVLNDTSASLAGSKLGGNAGARRSPGSRGNGNSGFRTETKLDGEVLPR